ncbi:hypothetical protein PVK06_039463 [Gossypium arboreum]|uniref:Reverse transcriptase zinc-binding domain-containing protein n=1 Tax=Gossypium arboreum TaxID=29729 RepID=A0ABR0N3K9_GOSAR|nr:hypothetical protein PVK06_039463 [Gossypium arboreum]
MVIEEGLWNLYLLLVCLPNEIISRIISIPPPHPCIRLDKVTRMGTLTGSFTIKSAYKQIKGNLSNLRDETWNIPWKYQGPQMVRMFLWLVLKHCLLTQVERLKRSLTNDDHYMICRAIPVDTIHTIKDCRIAKEVWSLIVPTEKPCYCRRDFERQPRRLDHWVLSTGFLPGFVETELAKLALNEEEEEAILQIQLEPNTKREVQIHNVPTSLFSKNLAMQLGNFIGKFMEYDGSNLGKENRNFMRIRVRIDIRHPLKRKKQVMFYEKCSYVRFKYERLSLFSFYCGFLGHSDSFCGEKMVLGVEITEIGQWGKKLSANQVQTAMDHDLKDRVFIGEEGKKKARGRFKN